MELLPIENLFKCIFKDLYLITVCQRLTSSLELHLSFYPIRHTFSKKIRNNILKSGNGKWHTRLLMNGGKAVTWVKCYRWDNDHGLPIHQELIHEHLYPNQAKQMRNHLAEVALNSDMLNLIEGYLEYHPCDVVELAVPISLLHQTIILISVFRDRRSIVDGSDKRLIQRNVLGWFKSWETSFADSRPYVT